MTTAGCPQLHTHLCKLSALYFIAVVRHKIELVLAQNQPIMDTRYEIIKIHHCLVVPTTGTTNGCMKDMTLMVACQVECASSVAALSAKMTVFQIILTPLCQDMHAIR